MALADDLAAALTRLRGEFEARCGALETRIAALEARTPVRFRGVFSASEVYQEGDIVVCRGSGFVARRDGVRSSPRENQEGAWSVIAMKGRDGKDGRDGADAGLTDDEIRPLHNGGMR